MCEQMKLMETYLVHLSRAIKSLLEMQGSRGSARIEIQKLDFSFMFL